MPSVFKIRDDQWKAAAVSADFSDENFGFLGGFQEILPSAQLVKEKKGKTKKQKKDKSLTKTSNENEPKKKKSKKLTTTEVIEENVDIPNNKDGEKTIKARKRKQAIQTTDDEFIKKMNISGGDTSESTTNLEAEIQNSDDINLSTWEKFHLDDRILAALRELKFTEPTPIQDAVLIPAVRDRLDILGTAETGSGKTIAFVIPVISRLLETQRTGKGVRALVLAPTRELAVQILKTFKTVASHAGFKVASIVGGLAEQKQIRVMNKQKPEILVATPGRLWDLINQADNETYLADFSDLQCLVIDETDRMIEHGHFKELSQILEKVKSASTFAQQDKLQTLVFSATLTYVLPEKGSRPGQTAKQRTLSIQEKTKMVIESTGLRSQYHKVIDLTRMFGTAEKIVETRINCTGLLDKDVHLVYLLHRYSGRTLIFTNSIDASRRLFGILTLLGFTPLMLHANMIQRQRLRNLERFSSQPNSILLATDVAARGLDIKGIQHVIHYQVSKTAEMYIHRSGRTARASETGLTVLMVDPKDAHLYRRLCKNLNRDADLPVFPIDMEELLNTLHHRVRIASDLDTLSYRAKKLNETWFEKMAREADLEIDDRDKEREKANDEYNDYLRKQDKLKAELRSELRIPLPNIQRQQLPKTRFITPEISAQYEREVSSNVLDELQEQLDSAKQLKKRNRRKFKLQKTGKT